MAEHAVKPKVFVGCASEAKPIAQAFCNELREEASVIPWWQSPEFKTGFSTLEGLIKAVEEYDFSIFILTPDDRSESRGKRGWSARDNVLLEFGLFLGQLGRDRTFIFVQEAQEKGKTVKIPSDLLGVHIPRFSFRNQHDLIASVNAATSEARQRIRSLGRMHGRVRLVNSWGFNRRTGTFSMTLSAVMLDQNKEKLTGKKLVLVARRHHEDVNPEDDNQIAVGVPRKLSEFARGDLTLRASGRKLFRKVGPGDVVDGHLLLVPEGLGLGRCRTISEMIEQGAELVEGKGRTVSS